VVLSDAANHASMIEGIRHSRANKYIFAHSDAADLDRKLATIGPDGPSSSRSNQSIRWMATSPRSLSYAPSRRRMER
jgi:hypothetical protein